MGSNNPRFETKEAAYQPGSPTVLALKDSGVLVGAIIGLGLVTAGIWYSNSEERPLEMSRKIGSKFY